MAATTTVCTALSAIGGTDAWAISAHPRNSPWVCNASLFNVQVSRNTQVCVMYGDYQYMACFTTED
eukprot:48540-Heterocapsa_arctica.AAC.1